MKTIALVTMLLTGVVALAQQATPTGNLETGKRPVVRTGCW
jgi:hypothetical protein